MMTRPKSIALLAALAVLGVSALAVARDETPMPGDRTASLSRSARTPDACPPSACTIVFKTDKDGPPSRLVAVD
ncbi:MAG: hypothetical protein GX458_10365 [Phyllobacteriaceae bacterium]|nr:hypothetical protein [Phyllobacteriaceae bacterium]